MSGDQVVISQNPVMTKTSTADRDRLMKPEFVSVYCSPVIPVISTCMNREF